MRVRLLVSAIVLVQSLLIYLFVAQRFPLSGDDYSYLYQARLFAAGKFYATDPLYDYREPLNRCIAVNCLRDEQGRRFSKYAPGWPALLAVGVAANAFWLVQPLLAALLTFLLLGEIDRRFGSALVKPASILLVLCLFYAYYGASLRPHLATALCIFGAFLLWQHGQRQGRIVWLMLAGAALGFSALMRYLDWVPLAAWIALSIARSRRYAALTVFIAACGIVASGNLAYGWILSGHPLIPPTNLGGNIGDHDRLSITFAGVGITAARLALVFAVFPPAALLVRYWRRGHAAGFDATPVLLFLANAAIYYLFAAAVAGPGPRYYFSYFPFLVIAVVDFYARFVANGGPADRRWWHLVLAMQVVVSVVFIARETYTLYWRRDAERTLAAASAVPEPRFIWLRTGTYHTDAMDLTRNPAALDAVGTLYLANCDPAQIETLRTRFPGREVYGYSYPGQLNRVRD